MAEEYWYESKIPDPAFWEGLKDKMEFIRARAVEDAQVMYSGGPSTVALVICALGHAIPDIEYGVVQGYGLDWKPGEQTPEKIYTLVLFYQYQVIKMWEHLNATRTIHVDKYAGKTN